ncbi:glycosyltransferase [Solimonas flava]|uniref:glycosyltransferase n=1 Tax=Solimonas flava TaxID=415849 RepID=UPI000480A481|nr:glycosyltransferase [Solimonas flava]
MSRILRCIDTVAPQYGGPSYSVINSSRIMARRGHKVTIVTMDRTGDVPLEPDEPFELVCLGPGFSNYRINPAYLVWLSRHLRSYDFATVQGVWRFASYGFHLVNRLARVPYMVMPHGSLDVWDKNSRRLSFLGKKLYWNLLESSLYRRAEQCYFTAEQEQRSSAEAFSFEGVKHSVIAYGSVDRRAFRLEPREADRISIAYLGRLHQKKGIEILLAAFAAVYREEPLARLRIAGGGEASYVASLRAQVSELGIERHVEWVGHVSGESKDELLINAGLFVLPSYQENFGLAVAETLSYGTPVAVSANVNTAPAIAAASAGYVCENSVSAVTDVLRVWKNGGYRDPQIRIRARACFEQSMSLERFVDDLVARHAL